MWTHKELRISCKRVMDFIPRSVHESFQVSSFPFAHGCCYRYTIFTFTFLFLFFSTSSRFSKIFKKIFNLSPAVSLSLVIVTTHALQSILVYYPTVSRCISRNSCRKKYSPGILFIAYFSFEQSRSSAINFDETSELSTKELLFIACVVSFISIHTYTHIYSLIRYFSTQLYIITTCVGKCSIQIRSIDIAGTEKKT